MHAIWRRRPVHSSVTAQAPPGSHRGSARGSWPAVITRLGSWSSWKERKLIGAALRPIYQAESAAVAAERLEAFAQSPLGKKYPAIAQSWRRNWEQVIPFFAFAPEVRKILYTTNAIESLNGTVRKAVRVRGHFPSDEAAMKPIWLVLRNVEKRWKNPPIAWQAAKAQLAIQFEERFLLTD